MKIMEDFKHIFLQLCEELNVKPDKNVLLRIDSRSANTRLSLDLSTCVLSSDTCKVLGLALSKDVHLTELSFCDCMLFEEGLLDILHGLQNNTLIRHLNLKGNNIRSCGAEAVGKLLRHNYYLQHLSLEWNALGILPEKFSLLTRGLEDNTSVKVLDLRNNQLNHQCATDLANVIMKNNTLESLDLRWNNLGLLGGRNIFKALSKNKTIIKLEVAGSSIPVDIIQAIEIAALHNADTQLVKNEQLQKAKILTAEIRNMESEKSKQLKTLMDTLERKESDISTYQKLNTVKVNQLQETIAEKDSALNSLTSEYQQLKFSLTTAETKLKDLSALLKEMEQENTDLRQQHHNILGRERKERNETELKLLSEIGSLKENNTYLEQQVNDLQKSQRRQENYIHQLKNTIDKLDNQIKLSDTAFKEQLEMLKEKHKEALQEYEILRQKDVSRMKSEASDIEINLRDRIHKLESQKRQLEEEISEVNKKLMTEISNNEELLSLQRQKLYAEKEELHNQLQEKLTVIQLAKDKQEKYFQEQQQLLHSLQTKNASLTFELEEVKHKVDYQQQCLLQKEEDVKLSVTKVKLEVKEQLEELNQTKEANNILSCQIRDMEKQLVENEKLHMEHSKLKENEIEKLKSELLAKEDQICRIRQDEAKRASLLQIAFMSYFNTVNQISPQPS